MRTTRWITAGAAAAALAGCVSYPVYQPGPVARLSPEQSAALAARPIDPVDRERYAKAEVDADRQDQADFAAQRATVVPYTDGYPAYGYGYGWTGYPYGYSAFYPWYPGISLSFGYRGSFGGHYRGGYGGHYGGHFRGRR